MNKVALITGVTGQDGSLLSEFLLQKGYVVYGMCRRTSSPTDWRLRELGLYINPNFHVVSGDVTDYSSISSIVSKIQPNEIYNLAAQSYVGASWNIPLSTHSITGIGAINVFEAARAQDPNIKIYQASSSEMFGGEKKTNIMDEGEQLHPRSPYGVAKCCAHLQANVNRESYGQFISCGILFNHESEYRGIEFVTRKITDAVARIYLGVENRLVLGCIDSVRDWGYAQDYVDAMWRMLQQDNAEDFVIATGIVHSIEDLLDVAFNIVHINDWQRFIVVTSNPRPADVFHLCGNATKAKEKLGWTPTTNFEQMIRKMVLEDIKRVAIEKGISYAV